MLTHLCLPFLLLLLCLGAVRDARAAGDAREGQRLAEQWCTSCHVVGQKGRGGDAAPPFIALANNPAKTETYLKGWISNPHPPMPNFNLSRRAINDLVAYIRSLAANSHRAVP
jgi:mono/diheme cytochrome c family protein